MQKGPSRLSGVVRELRRRRMFRTAGLYIVGAWLVLQAASLLFPAWGLPDAALNTLLIAVILAFPLALVFGWYYDITPHGIVRTPAADDEDGDTTLRLRRSDFALLAALALVAAAIIYDTTQDILDSPGISSTASEQTVVSGPLVKPANSIAVLPFVNISNDPNNEAFCDGISVEILDRLGKLDELHVIGRTSSFSFKGSDYLIPRISNLLGVRYLLQGSVRKEDDQLRISVQLLDDTGAQRWSESFDQKLVDVFAIQTEIADVVAATIVPHIAPQPARTFEPDLVAYQHYLAGRELLYKRDMLGARAELEKAIEVDPRFAEAYAELAIAKLIGIAVGRELVEQAGKAIDVALALEPGLPRALAARGLLLGQQANPDWVASEAVLREALQMAPTMVDAMLWLANPISNQGREHEVLPLLERALKIDPLHATITAVVAKRYIDRGEVERGEQLLLRLVELPNPGKHAFTALRRHYYKTGELVKMNAIEKRLALTGLHYYNGLALNYAVLGLSRPAAYWIEQTNRYFPDYVLRHYNRADLPMWRGEFVEAVRIIESTLAANNASLNELGQYFGYYYGFNQALAGEHALAIEKLDPLFGDPDNRWGRVEFQLDGSHALAWSYIASGTPEKARPILEAIEQWSDNERKAGVRQHDSFYLYMFAQNAVLLGDHDLALERFEQAIAAGWREYYIKHNDPRWAVLADNARYQTLMAEVKADVDRQRAEIESIDAKEDFPALLDRVRASN